MNKDKGAMQRCLQSADIGILHIRKQTGETVSVPVLFLYRDGRIYINGYPEGGMLVDMEEILPEVCFSVPGKAKVVLENKARSIKNGFWGQGVEIKGRAGLLCDLELKRTVLREIAKKYMPAASSQEVPCRLVIETQVIEVLPEEGEIGAAAGGH
ncbi:MAG: pyridoxamine 5'-phosphate oxidase family protein [Christensenellaceae bacterium]|jgi:nitroimidazol reductase NimA-like FMN-containing flavoprotein (pyridoxamine 5'-phosphate oxidase superfamily)